MFNLYIKTDIHYFKFLLLETYSEDRLSSKEIESVTQFQILDVTVYVLLCANALEKGMNLAVPRPCMVMVNWVLQSW